jgi:hypothetical protein
MQWHVRRGRSLLDQDVAFVGKYLPFRGVMPMFSVPVLVCSKEDELRPGQSLLPSSQGVP